MERRSNGPAPELRAAGDGKQPTISGYAARYYVPGDSTTEFLLWENAVERIKPGAFDQALQSSDVRALFNHDPNYVLGRNKSGTLQLASDDRGLSYEITPSNTTAYRDVAEMLARGDVSGSSFRFRVVDESWTKENGLKVREIRSLELLDVGPVTFPAYEGASSSVRSEFAEARSSHDRWANTLSQETTREKESRLRKELLPVS